MALPKISHPIFDVIVPSTKKKLKIRPMLVKEEKILLMAKASDDTTAILPAIKQVVNNCIVDNDVDIDRLALFDIEYLFVKIRSFSVSNISKVSYRDNSDNKIYDFEVDLDAVEVLFPEKLEKNIKLTDTTGIIMKYPDASLYSDEEFLSSPPEEIIENLITRCIDKVYDGDEMFDTKTFTLNEVKEFIEQLDVNTYEKMKTFLTDLPKLYYKIEYKNSKDEDREIIMSALNDFFTLR
jgi:hypothetical protein